MGSRLAQFRWLHSNSPSLDSFRQLQPSGTPLSDRLTLADPGEAAKNEWNVVAEVTAIDATNLTGNC